MSREAIAAALARHDLPTGERLVAFSLASFAGSDARAWPGATAAAARAGLSRSRYLYDRERLVRRGLVVVEQAASGCGRASTVALPFASDGPWWEGDINAELFEAVLSRSRARRAARLMLAAMAALADESAVVRGLSGVELCAAGGVDDHTYRRARKQLLESGELVLVHRACGRGNTNVWEVRPPDTLAAGVGRPAGRAVPPVATRPLLAAVAGTAVHETNADRGALAAASRRGDSDGGRIAGATNRPALTGFSEPNRGQDRTISDQNCPALPEVSVVKGGQDRTLLGGRLGENPARTPAANARAGRESQNPRTTEGPPDPPAGGSLPDSILVEETYVTDRGRKRQRTVRVDLAQVRLGLDVPAAEDRESWGRIRDQLAGSVSETAWAVWFAPLQLIAVDRAGALVIGAPEQTVSWFQKRFGRLIARSAEHAGRDLRLAEEPERLALGSKDKRPAAAARGI